MSHYELDARRLLCPMPVIRTEKYLRTLAAGDTIDILCSDPGALYDIPAWCRMHGHAVINSEQRADGELCLTVRVGSLA